MKKEELVTALIDSAERNGVLLTLSATFGPRVHLTVPYSAKAQGVRVETLDFSVRACNSLLRTGLCTLGDVIQAVENGTLSRIRNLSKRTENEIKTKILLFAYEQLTPSEKVQFFNSILEKNPYGGKDENTN